MSDLRKLCVTFFGYQIIIMAFDTIADLIACVISKLLTAEISTQIPRAVRNDATRHALSCAISSSCDYNGAIDGGMLWNTTPISPE